VPSNPLRYALAAPVMPFPALAALAGRSPLGGGREVVISAFVVARLAASALPPAPLAIELRAARAARARAWLAAVAMPASTRGPLTRLIDATGRDDTAVLRSMLLGAIDAVARTLDAPSRGELNALVAHLPEH
jgi:hypothetical protein